MKKIKNPFVKNEGYNCFGCSPSNPLGLKMEFFETDTEVISHWIPNTHFNGFDTVLHGGIQATLMDEIASWYVFVKLKTAGMTTNLNVQYKSSTLTDKGQITLKAVLKERIKNIAHIQVSLFDGDQKLCSEGIVQYFIFPEAIARKRVNYPGIESFYYEE